MYHRRTAKRCYKVVRRQWNVCLQNGIYVHKKLIRKSPYVWSTRNKRYAGNAYAYEMTDEQHREMSEALHQVKGYVVLSGYDCPLYNELFAGWHRSEKATFADGARERTEVLWLNFAPNGQIDMFKEAP